MAEKKAATRRTPPTPQTETVGRRYTRKERTTFSDGGAHEQLDLDRVPSLRARKARAVGLLKAAGVPVAQLLGDPPSGTLLIERVIHLGGNELDSPLGLAAQIVAACCELEQWAALGESNPQVVQQAYLLGYLVALQKAYDIDGGQRSTAAHAGGDAQKRKADLSEERVRAAFSKLPERNRGRDATAQIVKSTGLGADTVRKYLKAIRKTSKPE